MNVTPRWEFDRPGRSLILRLLQEWFDPALKWNPDENGGVEVLYVPATNIWNPDIVLYNTWVTIREYCL